MEAFEKIVSGFQENSTIYVYYGYPYYGETFKIPFVWDFDVHQILSANTFSPDTDDIFYALTRTYQ